jgi:putative MATE family efflux protein
MASPDARPRSRRRLDAARKLALLDGPVGPTVLRLAAPMLVGILAIVLFNVVDTFWVGQLGAHELAAMSYTFPVVMVVMSLAMGVGIGTTAVVARAIGHGDRGEVQRLTTHALVLALVIVVPVSLLGLVTIDPLFSALGADAPTRALVRQYMVPYYLGVGLLVVPMVGNSALRATGDTRTPSYVMLVAGIFNAVLDPFLIFGWGPAPKLGLAGAALATIGSYAGALVASIWMLHRRENLLTFARPRAAEVLDSWRRILHIGLPAAATNLLSPLCAGILTRLVSSWGPVAVAAFGVGTRLESFALVGISALSTAVTPLVAQNLGAGNCDRIRATIRYGMSAAIVWGAGAAIVLGVLASPLSSIFSPDAEVVAIATTFLVVVPFSYGALGLAQIVGTSLNALDRPLRAATLVSVRLVVLTVPLAWAGAAWLGLTGVFWGVAAANLLIGAIAIAMVRRQLRQLEADAPAPVAQRPALAHELGHA